jgi:predicted NBD/HSP70 family sugar kinase
MRPNQRRTLAFLARVDVASRADVARELGLPKATVAGIVGDLVERGLVTEAPPAEGRNTPGRPARVLALTGPASAIGVLAWSVGELRATVVTVSGQILATRTVPLEQTAPRSTTLDRASAVLADAAAEAGHEAAGLPAVVFGVPAPLPSGRSRSRSNAVKRWEWIPTWLDDELAEALTRRLGVAVSVENDANLGALGEHVFGAGRGRPDMVYVKLGRHSIGSGLIIGGRLHRGATGFAGELGHIQVRDNGPLCPCGGRGCLLQTIFTELVELAQPAYDEPLTFAAVLARANAGDAGLRRLLVDLGRGIGRPLADLCTMLNPDLIVLDGSVGPCGRHIVAGLTETIDRHATPATATSVRVVAGDLDADAEVLGAVALVRHAWNAGGQ